MEIRISDKPCPSSSHLLCMCVYTCAYPLGTEAYIWAGVRVALLWLYIQVCRLLPVKKGENQQWTPPSPCCYLLGPDRDVYSLV